MLTCSLYPLTYHSDPAFYFQHLQALQGAVLLDSGYPMARRGRFDICSALPIATISPNPKQTGREFLQQAQTLASQLAPAQPANNIELPFTGGLLGYLNYEFAADTLCANTHIAQIGLYDWAVVSDHHTQHSYLVLHPQAQHKQAAILALLQTEQSSDNFKLLAPFSAQISKAHYCEQIAKVKDYILAGDCYQINFTQRFASHYQGNPWHAYSALRAACPTPCAGFVRLAPDEAIVSLSPERFIACTNGQVETKPIKGTRPRGATPEQDQALAQALLASDKDRAENLMIVDLMRNDIAQQCTIGSVKVPLLFGIESYPNVHHLVTTISGTLKADSSALNLLADCFPGGSITGAPKIRAMQIIRQLEARDRGIYCGSLFYLDSRGNFDSSICIRTLRAQQGEIECFAGGGIVLDSNADDEYQESLDKVDILLRTLEAKYA